MTPLRALIALGCAVAALPGCGREPASASKPLVEPTSIAAPSAPPAPVVLDPSCDREMAERTLVQCKVCHSMAADQPNLAGPNLFGVHGRRAGEEPGFAYSPTMRASGIVWDDTNLDRYLASPQTTVLNTRMAFGGIKDVAARAATVCYLKALK